MAKGKHETMEILQPDTVELPQKETEKLNVIEIAKTFLLAAMKTEKRILDCPAMTIYKDKKWHKLLKRKKINIKYKRC